MEKQTFHFGGKGIFGNVLEENVAEIGGEETKLDLKEIKDHMISEGLEPEHHYDEKGNIVYGWTPPHPNFKTTQPKKKRKKNKKTHR